MVRRSLGRPSQRRRASWPGVAAAIAAIAIFNVLNNLVAPSSYALTRPAELLLLAVLAWGSGLALADLGLAPSTWARGLRWAAPAVGIVVVVYGVAIALPVTRVVFLDRRADLVIGFPLLQAVIATAVGTVVLEEFAFRGVLWGLVDRLSGPTYATVLSSVLFGLWHLLPSLRMNLSNEAIADLLGSDVGATRLTVGLAIAFTVLAGVVLCELRRRSGSLLAPVGLHLATNCLGYVFSAVAWATG